MAGGRPPIWSPIPKGSGALVVHRCLAKALSNYEIRPYHPYRELLPWTLRALKKPSEARIIHTIPEYGIFFAQRASILVRTFHNFVLDAFMWDYSNGLQKLHYRTDLKWWTRLGIEHAHALTAVSQFTAEIARQNLKPERPIQVIYNGIDSERFHPPLQKKPILPKLQVLFSGNLSQRKGAQWLLPISQRLQGIAEIFYTSGLRVKKHFREAENLTCLGSIPYQKMPELYRSMDVLVFPTVREGFSMAVLEAMATGLPVVASNCSSLPEQIDHGKGGYLCPIGDYHTFAKYIIRLAQDREVGVAMGEYNRARIETRFTEELMLEAYTELFERIAHRF